MKPFMNGGEFDPELTFVELESTDEPASIHRIDDTKMLLIDVVNPQPKSAKSFYARLSTTQPKTTNYTASNQTGRIRRNSKKKQQG